MRVGVAGGASAFELDPPAADICEASHRAWHHVLARSGPPQPRKKIVAATRCETSERVGRRARDGVAFRCPDIAFVPSEVRFGDRRLPWLTW